MNTSTNNISPTSRVVRIGTGLALAVGVGATSGTLGVAAILPLVAIYPLMTGALGWDPIVTVYNRVNASSSAVTGTGSHAHAA